MKLLIVSCLLIALSSAQTVSVCYKDNCRGTSTNPIPDGEQWIRTSANFYDDRKCCLFFTGRCDLCMNPEPVVCYKDNCRGTPTNPIPDGEQWINTGEVSQSGCCGFWNGACTRCVRPSNAELEESVADTALTQSILETSGFEVALLLFALVGLGSVFHGFCRSFVKVQDYDEVSDVSGI